MRHQPFDRQFGIEPPGFRQGQLPLINLAFERIRGGQIDVRYESTKSGVDCLMVFVDSGIEVTEVKIACSKRLIEFSATPRVA